ncbi:sigma-70 family RNA polymerase sigma factor [Phytohabitans sp. ZYX-F-186]|uniref:Sigma-70 family RNA polymerase sigma factor n=1 Tax=Phytohabitans maris TaxID=3071409 RepID=A0ABU0ZXS8_9ACTN|nr:sigma-70 family RNA polymerase sigma factor [Phytohabitans sp. ZYX-F-186]MDQ7911000.1 sigma-70 family RNA polymerase sigma factor [Phytohabitans sp. ZYX-F-186]
MPEPAEGLPPAIAASRDLDERDDAELVRAANEGDTEAFAVLYRRYAGRARRAAARWSIGGAQRDDIVSESFGRLLATLRNGGGPRGEFLPYLLRVIHNVAVDQARQERFAEPRDDLDLMDEPSPSIHPAASWQDEVLAEAFRSLSSRWRQVLWHIEVESLRPATVARMLGLSPNAVAALAYRARRGLREAYLRLRAAAATAPNRDLTGGSGAAPRPGPGVPTPHDAAPHALGDDPPEHAATTKLRQGRSPPARGAWSRLRRGTAPSSTRACATGVVGARPPSSTIPARCPTPSAAGCRPATAPHTRSS